MISPTPSSTVETAHTAGRVDAQHPDPSSTTRGMAGTPSSAAAVSSAAAISRFRELNVCERLAAAKQRASIELALTPQEGEQQAADAVLARISEQVRKYEPRCKDLSAETIAAEVYPATLKAADAGDSMAARCYVAAIFDSPSNPTEEEIKQYKANAVRLAEDGVRHGDWAMVASLASQYNDSPKYGPFGSFVDSDLEKAYGYTKLQALGATGDFALSRAAALDAIARLGNLTTDRLALGNKWAEETYRLYFKDSKVDGVPPHCEITETE